MTDFYEFFSRFANAPSGPMRWQKALALPDACHDRLIRIPTGFGKTLGVLATWAWRRLILDDNRWPRRLIWCLPMRVLVEQTEAEVRAALNRSELFWDEDDPHDGKVGIHLLMGGEDAREWHMYPEAPAVLIGTQDMLLSRAMNRGYASARARWPMDFGLLSQDALWVMDEVQLMDVGLATSAQLQAFRDSDRQAGKSLRPVHTWWMSATLQSDWLNKSPDTIDLEVSLERNTHRIEAAQRSGRLWDDVEKPVQLLPCRSEKELAKEVGERHLQADRSQSGPTLVVLNTVERAFKVWQALKKDRALANTDIRLVHSRFRPAERQNWRQKFLNREACTPGTDRIIVATQVIEAGVDISATLLLTELAPWPSLVQRFGRCARWGGRAAVMVVDFDPKTAKQAVPYTLEEIEAARDACTEVSGVSPKELEAFEENHPEKLPTLYPYAPVHLLMRHELEELFDTTPDLSGADIDISRFIRSGDERDLQVFWEAVAKKAAPASERRPLRDELCNVPFLKVRDWLCKPNNSQALKDDVRAWVWDWQDGAWRQAQRRDFYPGQTVLVEAGVGGYDPESGWSKDHTKAVLPPFADRSLTEDDRTLVPCWRRDGDGWQPSEKRVRRLSPEVYADAAEDDESLSIRGWQTIASHGLQAGKEARSIATTLAPNLAGLLHLAGRWHDSGKAHPAFQGSIQADNRPDRDDIAKAPNHAWPCSLAAMYRIDASDQRHGFRHELASTLALFGVLQRHAPNHSALLGPWKELLAQFHPETPESDSLPMSREPTTIEQEILDLDGDEFNLLTYLVCAHHGKVRVAWHSSPADQKSRDSHLRIRGLRDGDILPPLCLADPEGRIHTLPATPLDLAPASVGLSSTTGASWSERVLGLLQRHGPFTLAWLEALLRAADQRATRRPLADPLLANDNNHHGLERKHSPLAKPASERTPPSSPQSDSASRRPLDGDGRGTGGREPDSGTTRSPHSATRYLNTRLGVLSYQQLAPLLAKRVAHTELAIADRIFANRPIHDLIGELHRQICADLIPDIAGSWRRQDVRVGDHQPPPHWQVPMLMHNYAADLEARLAASTNFADERLIENLVFAEGQLLHIHPFDDFNGRVTRLFLIELLYRLDLPLVDTATSAGEETQAYFAALRAYDKRDPRPLAAVWRHRFEQEV